MSVRLEMLQAASLSPSQLGASAPLCVEFLRSQLAPEGGFRDRGGRADLYYTVFGLEALLALGAPVPPGLPEYLEGFGLGEELDLVHLCCLIRCRASAGLVTEVADAGRLIARLESYRAPGGGYSPESGPVEASAYGCFLVAMAYQDLGRQLLCPSEAVRSLMALRTADGGFGNQSGQAFGLTPSAAAVAALLPSLGEPFPPGLDEWLLSRCHPGSGFFAVPAAPIPDLLSTATALHALSRMGVPFGPLREPCLDFIQSLWNGAGAFTGSWADPTPDCEYTYYGLLALGHLSQ
jgi:prenyltransferase beta subunit